MSTRRRSIRHLVALRLASVLALVAAAIGPAALADDPAPVAAATLADHHGWVIAGEYSRDGEVIVTAGGDSLLYRPGGVIAWKADGAKIGDFAGHPTAVWSVRISDDGRLAATAGYDGLVKLWDVATRGTKHDLRKHKGWVRSVAFSPDGTRLVSGSLDGAVKLWDVTAKGEQEGPERTTSCVWSVAFAPDGKTILVGSHAGARLLPTPAAKLLPPPPPVPVPASPPSPPQPAVASATTPLVPTEFTSMAGATATITADGIVTVTGPLAKDTYTLKAILPAGVKAQAFQIEALTDPALPQQGPGRAGNGNFVLSTFAVLAGPTGGNDASQPVKFSAAKADFEPDKYLAAAAIDDKADTGWAIGGGIGKPHTATFTVAAEPALQPGAPVTITLDQQYGDGQHTIGKFRLSIIPVAAAEPAKEP